MPVSPRRWGMNWDMPSRWIMYGDNSFFVAPMVLAKMCHKLHPAKAMLCMEDWIATVEVVPIWKNGKFGKRDTRRNKVWQGSHRRRRRRRRRSGSRNNKKRLGAYAFGQLFRG